MSVLVIPAAQGALNYVSELAGLYYVHSSHAELLKDESTLMRPFTARSGWSEAAP